MPTERATLDDLLTATHRMFLPLRLHSATYHAAMDLLRLTVEGLLPTVGRIRRDQLTTVIQKRIDRTLTLTGNLRTAFPGPLNDQIALKYKQLQHHTTERRAALFTWWATLPTISRNSLETYYRKPLTTNTVTDFGEFTSLHLEALHQIDRNVNSTMAINLDVNESAISQLTLQRVVGDFSEERRLVLEALLMGDNANQQLYLRLMLIVAEFEWLIGPKPDWSTLEIPVVPPWRERLVTWAFIVGVISAIGSVIYTATR